MAQLPDFFYILVAFGVIALAARQIGEFFTRLRLPLITGYLFTGLLVGPFVLGFASEESLEQLRFIDEISLAFIAFAAGRELYLPELRGRLSSIGWVTAGLVLTTLVFVTVAMLLLADYIPFMRVMEGNGRFAVALLAGSILTARSPSSAIAIVTELRARGPFTQMALGVTVIMDFIVIMLFALSTSIADALFAEVPLNINFIFLLLIELALVCTLGFALYWVLRWVLSRRFDASLKIGLILLAGYSTFLISHWLRDYSHDNLPFELLAEPLLICMIASFLVNNYSSLRAEYGRRLNDIAPYIYIAFFTLTGESLELGVLADAWQIALALFLVRVVAVMLGSFTGGVLAGDPMRYNRVKWMAFITQAGVALGLAKEAAVEFPTLGSQFSTLIIAVVVLNEMIGPLFFKWAINHLKEAHTRAKTPEFDGVRDVIIFGVEGPSLLLARQLTRHNWDVKVACLEPNLVENANGSDLSDLSLIAIEDYSLKSLHALDAERADAAVLMLSDEENYAICELLYEQFGTETVVVRLNDRINFHKFHALGALVIDPATVMVGLLEQFVRSPSAASLLLGMEEGQDVVDIELRNPALHGIALRDLQLPLDTLVLSVHRNGNTIISHGYTQLEMGDRVTIVGKNSSLEEVMRRMDG
ncbi:monovalent cation:proton antiporter family protein [Candidatus Leptofilum sp.]|uniref:monovalent cation:proton antiporter family protein n=1 Tax=Candidatus Leptofilum sp. TaxID=3241576 RepID=UPI003B5C65F1